LLYVVFPQTIERFLRLLVNLVQDPEQFRRSLEDMGGSQYFFIILIQVLQIVVFPLPGQLSVIIAGLFGSSWGWILGFIVTLLGLTIGAVIAFLIGRYFFRDWISRKLAGNKTWQKFAGLSGGKGLWIIGLIYVVPGLPNDFMCYVLGLSRAPLSKFILVTTVCRIPNVIITFFLGYFLGFSNWWIVGLITGAIIIITFLGYRYRQRIESWIHSRLE
jgi:uncharacterized membrane protein YdjX (TVP38/TMEM64 family)